MNKIPYWWKAILGMNVGLARLFIEDDSLIVMDDIAYERTKTTHARLILGLNYLDEFSTRDYAYDFGGMTILDTEMDEFRYCEWRMK